MTDTVRPSSILVMSDGDHFGFSCVCGNENFQRVIVERAIGRPIVMDLVACVECHLVSSYRSRFPYRLRGQARRCPLGYTATLQAWQAGEAQRRFIGHTSRVRKSFNGSRMPQGGPTGASENVRAYQPSPTSLDAPEPSRQTFRPR